MNYPKRSKIIPYLFILMTAGALICLSALSNRAPAALHASPLAWTEVDSFESLSSGSLDGQNGWHANGATVTTDPADSSNQVLALTGDGVIVSKAFGSPIPDNSTGSIFLRIRQTDSTTGFAGSSYNSSPSSAEEFEMQFGVDRNRWRLFSGGYEVGVGRSIEADQWVCVWLHPDTSRNTFEMFVNRGVYEDEPHRLRHNTSPTFVFLNRGEQSDPFRSFYARTADDNLGTLYIDDIYMEPGGTNLDEPPGVDCQSGNDSIPTATPHPSIIREWILADNFESHSGSLDGEGGWSASGVSVIADPQNQNNKVIELEGPSEQAYVELPESGLGSGIPYYWIGTLFFRLYRDGPANGFAGLDHRRYVGAPNGSELSVLQVGSLGEGAPNQFSIHDDDAFLNGSVFMEEAWHCMWIVVNHRSSFYEVYVQGGAFEDQTKVNLEGASFYDFSSWPNRFEDVLSHFSLRMGDGEDGLMLIDDLYINPGREDLTRPDGSCPKATPPTPTVTPLSTSTPTSTNTPLPTNTPTSTSTPLPTDTPTSTNTPLPTSTPTSTSTTRPTDAPTFTSTPTATLSPTVVVEPTDTGQSASPTPTLNATAEPTETPVTPVVGEPPSIFRFHIWLPIIDR